MKDKYMLHSYIALKFTINEYISISSRFPLWFFFSVYFLVHILTLNMFSFRCGRSLIPLHVSALLESVVAAILTLLLVEPYGSLRVRSCPVTKLSDWYSMLLNPQPNYAQKLYCTQEIVYPL